MRKLFSILSLLSLAFALGFQNYPYRPPAPISGGGGGTFAYVQSTNSYISNSGGASTFCPASTTCAITITVHAGDIGVITATNNANITLSSVSGGGTWVVPAACHLYDSVLVTDVACAYNLSETSATTITVTWSGTANGGFAFYEYSYTGGGGTVSYDNSNAADNNTAATTQTGPTATLTGLKDVCVASEAYAGASSVAAPYSTPHLLATGVGSGYSSDYINWTSGTVAAVWTFGSASQSDMNVICLLGN